MGSPTLPSLFQLSRGPLSLPLRWVPRTWSGAAFCPPGTLKRGGRETAPLGTRWGVGLGIEGIVRSLGTWRARLTWRRLRGEGSALLELHCEHKAKAEGEGETGQPPGWPRPTPSKNNNKNQSHSYDILDSIFSHSRSHHEVHLQASLLFYAFSPGQCINCFRGTHVCVCVYREGRFRQRECNSTFVRLEVRREKQIQYKKWGNYTSDCFANFCLLP